MYKLIVLFVCVLLNEASYAGASVFDNPRGSGRGILRGIEEIKDINDYVEFEYFYKTKSDSFEVTHKLEKNSILSGGDQFKIKIIVKQDIHLYLYNDDGNSIFDLLKISQRKNNKFEGGTVIELPKANYSFSLDLSQRNKEVIHQVVSKIDLSGKKPDEILAMCNSNKEVLCSQTIINIKP
jgi:hypothetical protein